MLSFFSSPTRAPIINTMSNFSIFIPFLILLFYFFISYLTSTLSKQFSAPNLVWNSLKTAPPQIGAVSSQVSPKISPPTKILFPFYNGQKNTNKILHIKIILFSNNSFAILSIPYKQMISPTSSQKRKASSNSKTASSDKKNSISSTTLLDPKVALSTKLNCKAPQEPESCCLPESMEQSQGPNLAPQ